MNEDGSVKEGETPVNPTASPESQPGAQIPVVSAPQYSYYMPSMYSPNTMAPSSPVMQQVPCRICISNDWLCIAGFYYYPTGQPLYAANPSYERPANRWNSDPEANLFIYNIPPRDSDLDLQNLFAPFGTVLSAKVGENKGQRKMWYDFMYRLLVMLRMETVRDTVL